MTSTDLHAFLRGRRSIRKFLPGALEEAVLRRILETATYAPSAHNRQPWRFAVVGPGESRTRLAEAMAAQFARDLAADRVAPDRIDAQVERSRARIISAPGLIVLCMDPSEMDVYPDQPRRDAEKTMALQSTALAGLQLLLAAHAEGLAGVWICSPLFAKEAVRASLSLPPKWDPQAMLLIGRAADSPRPKEMKTLEDVVSFI